MSDPKKFRRIATEEAFSILEVAKALQAEANVPSFNLDMRLLKDVYDAKPGDPRYGLLHTLLDLGEGRIKTMDEHGVDIQLLLLTSPGVQVFDADTATELAIIANDRLADAIRQHPTRFAGLASFAPQSPKRAAKEMERAINTLKLNGVVVNSHTNGEYLDLPKYWPILEAAEALDACIYIHPRAFPDHSSGAFRDYGLENATWGYGLEVGTHAVRLIVSGVFDRFPKLKICIGHMGEAVHFWMWRLDFMNRTRQARGLSPKLQLKPSEYFKRNFVITTSGQEFHPALKYSIDVLGVENVLWAIDYPYQPTGPAVDFMNSAPISDEDKAKIYHGNAERVFHIKPVT